MILPGISGTGKTRLTRLYADALYGGPSAANPSANASGENEHYLLIAVQPDWHNARDLLGYYNALNGKFHPTPFLRFLMRATADPAALYFVCLDEMNPARPEYYLAPILSALETEDHLIDLGVPGDTVGRRRRGLRGSSSACCSTSASPARSMSTRCTHTLSDKLLDRANVIELTDVDLAAFRRGYSDPIDEEAWQVITRVHSIPWRARASRSATAPSPRYRATSSRPTACCRPPRRSIERSSRSRCPSCAATIRRACAAP